MSVVATLYGRIGSGSTLSVAWSTSVKFSGARSSMRSCDNACFVGESTGSSPVCACTTVRSDSLLFLVSRVQSAISLLRFASTAVALDPSAPSFSLSASAWLVEPSKSLINWAIPPPSVLSALPT